MQKRGRWKRKGRPGYTEYSMPHPGTPPLHTPWLSLLMSTGGSNHAFPGATCLGQRMLLRSILCDSECSVLWETLPLSVFTPAPPDSAQLHLILSYHLRISFTFTLPQRFCTLWCSSKFSPYNSTYYYHPHFMDEEAEG